MGNHLRYACGDRDCGSKKCHGFGLKTTLLTRKRAFNLTDSFEWVLGSWVHDKFTLVPFVIAIGHGLNGCHGFWGGGLWLGIDSLLGIRLADSSMQMLGQLLMLLGLLFSCLTRR